MRPDLCRKRKLVSCTLSASITGTSAATIKSASPQNPLASPVNKSCTGVQWLTRQFQQSRHVDIRAERLSKAIERVSCAHCLRDPQSCMMCQKCAPSYRKWRATPPHFKWWFSLASCRWACNLRCSTRPLGFAELSTSARLMDALFETPFSECLATPTSNGQTVHCNARKKTSVHRDLCHWCHEIHLQDLPKLVRASALGCHEQFLVELENV